MKKHCITLIMYLSIMLLTSCEMMYFSTNDTKHIESKQTIKTFEHLKEPIVITMPVYKSKHLFGNKNFAEQLEMLGHIFVVIDIETDSVYDWVYFPCEYYTNWRCSEIGTNPTIYCSTGAYGGPIGCLNPTKTTLDVYEAEFDMTIMNEIAIGREIILSKHYYSHEAEKSVLEMNIFDIDKQQFEQTENVIYTNGIGYLSAPYPDKEGKFWFSHTTYEDTNQLRYLDTKEAVISVVLAEFPYKIGEKFHDYNVKYVDDKYIYVRHLPLGIDIAKSQEIYIFDKENLSAEPMCLPVPDELDMNGYYLYKIANINGKIYGIFPGEEEQKQIVRFAEIDIEGKEIKSLDVVLDFDFTETVYPRGNRLYLMKSRNISNVFYTYYDFETGEIGEIINIKYEDIIGGASF